MTTWTEVINYVRTRYEVLEETDSWLRFRLDTAEDRTQQVSVHHVPDAHGAWLEISSPVGWADKIDLRRFLELAGTSTVGGGAVVDRVALLKHTVPLEDLSVREEFERPLKFVVARADEFEQELTDGDHF
ncbi:hypothetical protein JOF56_000231 [Kibdelosporangium banguiense]|uniref:Uncharacterized protein n=1 Tax=Kibdelosporangium banguiense TaxID=1365924 RepID=A0ABS4T5V2_9PSEU|nr:hypothetical protein [Kibdelosporangium banguiense]MBP2319846.1 hypothetical protein [Kibdelosporangium banguiense]